MHFVAALGSLPQIRPVLGLFEGAVSGMADGYARVTGKPALTLYHLGTGFTNAAANLHNARRAKSPVVNVVGDHATTHKRWDSPLKSDIEAIARPDVGLAAHGAIDADAVRRCGRRRRCRAREAGTDRNADPAGGHRLGNDAGACGSRCRLPRPCLRDAAAIDRVATAAARTRANQCADRARRRRRDARPCGASSASGGHRRARPARPDGTPRAAGRGTVRHHAGGLSRRGRGGVAHRTERRRTGRLAPAHRTLRLSAVPQLAHARRRDAHVARTRTRGRGAGARSARRCARRAGGGDAPHRRTDARCRCAPRPPRCSLDRSVDRASPA